MGKCVQYGEGFRKDGVEYHGSVVSTVVAAKETSAAPTPALALASAPAVGVFRKLGCNHAGAVQRFNAANCLVHDPGGMGVSIFNNN